jgi:hypothetical protein
VTSVPVPMCYSCVHLTDEPGMICDAFPLGIPSDIVESVFDHRMPHVGDSNIQFEQDPEAVEPNWGLLFEVFGES